MTLTPEPIVVLTGSGISAESGIPTFRGPDSLWQGKNPQQLATQHAFDQDPILVWRFYEWRRGLIAAGRPNLAHELLATIEQLTENFTLLTQNVDGYHQQAGSRKVTELHGSLWRLRCTHCPSRWEMRNHPLPELPPSCHHCGSTARPDVIWFGEALDPWNLQSAIEAAQRAQLLISIGTSSVVYPAAELPLIAKQNGAYTIEINPERTALSETMDEVIRESASVGLSRWWKAYKPHSLNADDDLPILP